MPPPAVRLGPTMSCTRSSVTPRVAAKETDLIKAVGQQPRIILIIGPVRNISPLQAPKSPWKGNCHLGGIHQELSVPRSHEFDANRGSSATEANSQRIPLSLKV